MRITADIVSAGSRWSVTFPKAPKLCEVFKDDKFDYASAISHLKRYGDRVQFGNSDDELCVSVAITFLDLIDQWEKSAASDSASSDDGVHRRIAMRAKRGISTKVRIDFIRKCGPKVRVRIRHSNPNNAVQTEEWDRYLALIFANIASALRDKFVENGYGEIVDFESDTMKLIEEAGRVKDELDRADEIRRRNENRLVCDSYRNGYCSPCKHDCPHYQNGKCVELPC